MAFPAARSIALAAFAGLLFAGPGAHAETRRVNNITTISSIEAEGRFKVEIVSGETAGSTITGAPEDVARVGIRYQDGKIHFREKCTLFCGRRDLNVLVKVVAPQVSSIEASKGVDVTATGLSATALSVDVVMGASLRAVGRCDSLRADVAMGGVLSGQDLACGRVLVDVSMGGVADVRASSEIRADATMGGAITVFGNPSKMDTSGSMGGTIVSAD